MKYRLIIDANPVLLKRLEKALEIGKNRVRGPLGYAIDTVLDPIKYQALREEEPTLTASTKTIKTATKYRLIIDSNPVQLKRTEKALEKAQKLIQGPLSEVIDIVLNPIRQQALREELPMDMAASYANRINKISQFIYE